MTYQEENKYNRLEELNGSDYQIVEGEPDITGWEVIDAQGRRIGEVDDVLFDTQTRDVRYMIVDLEENELDIDIAKKVLIPIGIAELPELCEEDDDEVAENQLNNTGDVVVTDVDDLDDENEYDDDDEEDELVYLPSVTLEHLMALPAYEKGMLTPETETTIRSVFEKPDNDVLIVYQQDTFYTHDHFNNKIYPKTGEASDELDRSDLGTDVRKEDDNPNRTSF
ncbi:PRC-barrel domain-containing protein [Mucilaginibacter antarcticus]|uniref:PRC-barrel domain-containing protein n=1 Tax=Mucilaginibacter antarcticus TaxID=1855725 RepID=A0ABW5XUQ4_9SPHI